VDSIGCLILSYPSVGLTYCQGCFGPTSCLLCQSYPYRSTSHCLSGFGVGLGFNFDFGFDFDFVVSFDMDSGLDWGLNFSDRFGHSIFDCPFGSFDFARHSIFDCPFDFFCCPCCFNPHSLFSFDFDFGVYSIVGFAFDPVVGFDFSDNLCHSTSDCPFRSDRPTSYPSYPYPGPCCQCH